MENVKKNIYSVIVDAVVRIIVGNVFYSAFFNLGDELGSQYRAMQIIGCLFISVFSCLIENIIEWVTIFMFKSKPIKNLYLIVNSVIFILFSTFYFYLFVIKNNQSDKINQYLFLVFMMGCGTLVRIFFGFYQKADSSE